MSKISWIYKGRSVYVIRCLSINVLGVHNVRTDCAVVERQHGDRFDDSEYSETVLHCSVDKSQTNWLQYLVS